MTNRVLIIAYCSISLLFLVGVCLSFYDYSYYGYISDKIINWLWLVFTLLLIFRFWNKRIIKIYFFSLLSLLFLSIIPMGIPFFGILNYFTTIGDYQQIKLNRVYRLERTRAHALSMTKIFVYKKIGIFEKNICRADYATIIANVLNVDRLENSLDEETTTIQSASFINANLDSIGIEYQILNKTKIIYHKIGIAERY